MARVQHHSQRPAAEASSTRRHPAIADTTIVRAVLFDLDDTLFDHTHCARVALQGVRAAHECFAAIPPDSLEGRHAEILEELHEEVMAGRLALDAARVERFRRLFDAAGVDADRHRASDAAALYRQTYLASRREVSGAAALLKAVRRRARVGVVSNNLLEEQRDKLRCCNLDGYVDVLVVSEEAGVSKPDPRIFELALQRLQCRPEEAVMIGDSWDADIVGATAAGIRAVWLQKGTKDTNGRVAVIRALEPTGAVLRTIFGDRPDEVT